MKKMYAVRAAGILSAVLLTFAFVSCKSTPTEDTDAVSDSLTQQLAPGSSSKPEKSDQPAETAVAGTSDTGADDVAARNKAMLEKVEKARQAAVDAGAPSVLKDAFSATDELYDGVKADAAGGADMSEACADLVARYEALEKAAKAYAAKQKIDEYNLSQYDQKNYARGEAAAQDIKNLYDNNASGKELAAKAEEGNAAFTQVLLTGLKKIAAIARADAVAAKKKADSVFAGVSEKEAYKAAADKIASADSNLVTNNPEGAYKGYLAAAADFTALYEKVARKREEAQRAMEEARNKIKNAAEYAAEADEAAPLGDGQIEGIEDEDAVLLEEETFDDPDKAVIDVDETQTGREAAELEAQAVRQAAEEKKGAE